MTATEGWGGNARKLHYIREATPLCGRASPNMIPFIDRSITTKNGTHNLCKRCMTLTGTIPVTIIEIGMRVSR